MADDEEVVEEEAPVVILDVPEQVSPDLRSDEPIPPPKYEVRPGLGEKFQAANVREIILTCMQEQLHGRQYRTDQAPRWTQAIANGVRQRVEGLGMKRYKVVVTCSILEMKGAGINCGMRCMWDPETDDYIGDMYRDETMFCYTVVYGLYMY